MDGENVVDLDAAMNVLLPWKLRIKVGGKLFDTRHPTVGQLAALDELSKRKGGEGEAMKILSQLFVDPKGAMDGMTASAFQLATRRIVSEAFSLVKKNAPLLDRAIALTVPETTNSTYGPLSPPSVPASPESTTR